MIEDVEGLELEPELTPPFFADREALLEGEVEVIQAISVEHTLASGSETQLRAARILHAASATIEVRVPGSRLNRGCKCTRIEDVLHAGTGAAPPCAGARIDGVKILCSSH